MYNYTCNKINLFNNYYNKKIKNIISFVIEKIVKTFKYELNKIPQI